MVKRKNKKWFIAVRGSYLPNSWQGWLTYVPFVCYLSLSLYWALKYTDSIGAATLFILPNWIAAAVVMTWLAKRTS